MIKHLYVISSKEQIISKAMWYAEKKILGFSCYRNSEYSVSQVFQGNNQGFFLFQSFRTAIFIECIKKLITSKIKLAYIKCQYISYMRF